MGKTSAKKNDDSRMASFEKSLAELETLVERMEGGELTLDESLKSFERGITLFRQCQGALDAAQLQVNKLTDADDDVDEADALPASSKPAAPSTSASFDDDDIPF